MKSLNRFVGMIILLSTSGLLRNFLIVKFVVLVRSRKKMLLRSIISEVIRHRKEV